MYVDDLKIPDEIIKLIDIGWWPSKENASKQYEKCLIDKENVKLIDKESDEIIFQHPPFYRLDREVDFNPRFWLSKQASLKEINPFKAVDIADFGMGSDSPILLDYRENENNPSVMFLNYTNGLESHWVKCADNFQHFMDILKIKCA